MEAFGKPVDGLAFVVHPEPWVPRLATVFGPREPIVQERRHYLCEMVTHDWRSALPEGYEVRLTDGALFDRRELQIPEHVRSWIVGNWGSVAAFLERGFGAVTIHGDRVVSWSVCDCVTSDACEIGIHTAPGFRRRGLAAATAAAAAECAFSLGYARVGWQCAEDNIGSIRTAERVGFHLARRYTMYDMFLNEAHHLFEHGWSSFKRGDHERTVQCHSRAIDLCADAEPLHYHLLARAQSALGRQDQALASLTEAIDRGWSDVAHTLACTEFDALAAKSEWPDLMDRIRANRTQDKG
jgi:RimJ/RimL family protein N-acetyltransferase